MRFEITNNFTNSQLTLLCKILRDLREFEILFVKQFSSYYNFRLTDFKLLTNSKNKSEASARDKPLIWNFSSTSLWNLTFIKSLGSLYTFRKNRNAICVVYIVLQKYHYIEQEYQLPYHSNWNHNTNLLCIC